MKCDLSIVVPVYGVEEYLAKCLDSLINQTANNYKILVINDGSKDNSQVIIDKYTKAYPDKVKGYIKENGGLSDARNYGLNYVDTPYVMFIDADDYVENDMVETCLKEIKDNDVDMVVFGYYQHYVTNNTYEIINPKFEGIYNLKNNPSILKDTANAAWNKIYKTSLFKDNNIIYPKGYLYEDLGTTPKLILKAKNIKYIQKALYHYLVDRPNNITRQVNHKILDTISICKSIVKYFKDNQAFDEYKEELYYLCKINCIENMRKVVICNNKELAYEYIDNVFDFFKDEFKDIKNIYNLKYTKMDIIYTNRQLAKMYYCLKK